MTTPFGLTHGTASPRNPVRTILYIFLFSLLSAALQAQPVVTSFKPLNGAVGTPVTVTGSNFDPVAANNIVYVGGALAPVVAATVNTLNIVVPQGASSRFITVTANRKTAYSPLPFTITFPGTDTAFLPTSFSEKKSVSLANINAGIPNQFAMCDFDGDGKQDVIAATGGNEPVSILRNISDSGNIAFEEPLASGFLSTGTSTVVTADFDGDGKLDFAVAAGSKGDLTVYRNISTPGRIRFDVPVVQAGLGYAIEIAVGDLDGDGRPDVIATNNENSYLVLFQNTTDSNRISFSRKYSISADYNIRAVRIGDLDGDNRPDIVLAIPGINVISILRNTTVNGTFAFAKAVKLPAAEYPWRVHLGDVDGDGKLDIATPNQTSNFLSIFRNVSVSGTITFEARKDYSSLLSPVDLFMEDLDGDGKLDFAIPNGNSGNMSVFRNLSTPGSISLAPRIVYPTGSEPVVMGGGDVDGDGKPDLLVSRQGGYGVDIYRNMVNAPVVTGISPDTAYTGETIRITGYNLNSATGVKLGGVAVTSFNVVSSREITAVVSAGRSGDVSVTSVYGTGTRAGFVFLPPPTLFYYVPVNATRGSTVTINGDNFAGVQGVSFGGSPALSFKVLSPTSITAVVGEGATGSIGVQNRTGTTTIGGFRYILPPEIRALSPAKARPGAELTITGNNFSSYNTLSSVFFGAVKAVIKAQSANSITVVVPAGASYGSVAVTVNGLTGYSSQPFTPVFPGAGVAFTPANFAAKADFTSGNYPVEAGLHDFDADGKPDLVLSLSPSNFQSGFAPLFRNTSTTGSISFASSTLYSIGLESKGLCISDLDGDGKQDFAIGAGSYTPFLYAFKNISTVGNLTFSYPLNTLPMTAGSIEDMVAADMDHDGKPDMVAVAGGSNTIALFRNTSIAGGALTFESKVEFALPAGVSGSKKITVADLDGDGKPELMVGYSATKTLTIFRNTSVPGTVSVTISSNMPVSLPAASLCTGDFDDDGKPDLVIAGYDTASASGEIAIYRNTGSAGAISLVRSTSQLIGGIPGGMAVADMDGDGRPDIVATNKSQQTVALFRNLPGTTLSFAVRQEYATGQAPGSVALGDIDGDGKPDMVVATGGAAKFSVLRNKVAEALVTPSGAAPVSGVVVNRTLVDSTVQTAAGIPYVQRHYDLEPQNNPASATGKVTLFFSQADFNNYNDFAGHGLNLPGSPGDATGKAALRVYQHHGTSISGMPGTYSGSIVQIDPDDSDIVWNAATQLWEVGFQVTGFSGFFVSTAGNAALPLQLLEFTGIRQGEKVLLQWSTSEEINMHHFEVERSFNGLDFGTIKVVAARNNPAVATYSAADIPGPRPATFYRLKMVNKDGSSEYSPVVIIKQDQSAALLVFPNPAQTFCIVQHPVAGSGGAQVEVVDAAGRRLKAVQIDPGAQQTRVNLRDLRPGLYHIIWKDGQSKQVQSLLVK